MAGQKTISDGDHVILKTEDKAKVFQINKTRCIYFEKAKVKGQEIVGQKYGTLFEVQQGKLQVVTSPENSANASSSSAAGKDNRDLVASGENQKLSQGDIMKMKEEGVSGQDIVEKLVEQSETFKTKTEFSQEKYIKKKKKKHMLMFRTLLPNSSLLLDTYKHAPHKICNLRADSLSQLLSYSNVMTGSKVAVVESCQGLVLGSVMERMGGVGRVVHLYPGNDMNRQVVRYFNFPEDHMKTLCEFPLNKLASVDNGTFQSSTETSSHSASSSETVGEDAKGDCSSNSASQQKKQGAGSDLKDNGMEVDTSGDDGEGGGDDGDEQEKVSEEDEGGAASVKSTRRSQREDKKRKGKSGKKNQAEQEAKRQQRADRLKEAVTILQERNLDSLIIATKYDPVALLLRLLPYVAPSRPVVVFCQHKEPLMECFTKVKENGYGVQLKLAESWYREYQVLPSRTHPLMNMSGTGGYLLSFIRVTSQQ